MHPTSNIAIKAVRKAAVIILRYQTRIHELSIDKKSSKDFVTEVDRLAEKIIIEELSSNFPNHSFLGEESGLTKNKSIYKWVIDPIDGTNNYIHNYPYYAISLALYEKDKIVFWDNL